MTYLMAYDMYREQFNLFKHLTILDNITIGHFKEEDNLTRTHQTLLGAGIYILENCALAQVPAGAYELLCLPLLMYQGDAGPCRAILRPL